jgi:hypothetical protein
VLTLTSIFLARPSLQELPNQTSNIVSFEQPIRIRILQNANHGKHLEEQSKAYSN